MADGSNWDRVPIEPQSIDAPLSRYAVFLVVSIAEGDAALATVREVLSDPGALVRTVGFRDLDGRLSCNIGIGSAAWDRLGITPGQYDRILDVSTAVTGTTFFVPQLAVLESLTS